MTALSGKLWPAHPKPYHDELLSSWLIRIAHANGLKLQTFCDIVFGSNRQLWNRDIDRLAPDWLLETLAEKTATPIEIVRRTTLDTYLGRLYRQKTLSGQLRWILPLGVYHRKRRLFGIQFCPKCLDKDPVPYFKTIWRVAVLVYCLKHRLQLYDRCPACSEPVAFHRQEMGKPETIDFPPISLCHACDFDLRKAEHKAFAPYNADIGCVFKQIARHVTGGNGWGTGHMDVLHQLCKVMVSKRKSTRLASFVAQTIGVPDIPITRGRHAFELRSIDERNHIIQLAAWLLANPQERLTAAWKARSVLYSNLVRDFKDMPGWYISITQKLNRIAKNPSAFYRT